MYKKPAAGNEQADQNYVFFFFFVSVFWMILAIFRLIDCFKF